MLGMAFQFIFNPLILWGCLHVSAKRENNMEFLGCFLCCTIALIASLATIVGLKEQMGPLGLAAVGVGSYFVVIFLWVLRFSYASTSRALIASLLFLAYRVAFEVGVYVLFVQPVA